MSLVLSQNLTRCRKTVSHSGRVARWIVYSLSSVPQAGPSGTTHEPSPLRPLDTPIPLETVSIPDPLSQFAVLPVPPADMSEQLRIYVTNLV